MNSFVALDVDTANANYASICSVGVCRFEDGLVVDEWYQLVDPRGDFGWKQIEMHGLRPQDVAGQPTFVEVIDEIAEFVDGMPVAHYGHLNRDAIAQACEKWFLPPPDWRFIDTLHAAKQAWPNRQDGYDLGELCGVLGHELALHHNALDDARGAGAVFLAASERLGVDKIGLLSQRIPKPGEHHRLWSDVTDLTLLKDVIVFSDRASDLSNDEGLQTTLKRRGAEVRRRLSNRTTIYVLSDAEWLDEESTAQRRGAAQRLSRGQRLQIMSERDFLAMIEHS